MTPTTAELRAAIGTAWAACDAFAQDESMPIGLREAPKNAAAILRAHLETFDEERAFLEAAMTHAAFRQRMGTLKGGIEVIGTQVDAMDDAYRALVAKREGK